MLPNLDKLDEDLDRAILESMGDSDSVREGIAGKGIKIIEGHIFARNFEIADTRAWTEPRKSKRR